MKLRTLLIGVALGAVAIPAIGYASWSSQSALSAQKRAELYAITQIEANWHRATSRKNLRLMMSLWAPRSTFTVAGKTYSGKPAIRALLSKAGPFQPQNDWVSETPAYKMRITVNGNRGTVYFECHYVDVDTKQLVLTAGIDAKVRKVKGKWLIVNVFNSTPTLKP
jgi:SnoaL-like domain